jgi:hypothetical protein
MERWSFDLNQIRKNWEKGSAVTPASGGAEPTPAAASVLAMLAELDDKNCPACGAELAIVEPTPETSPGSVTPGRSGSFDGLGSSRAAQPKFSRVAAPADPLPEAEALLARVRVLAHRQLAPQEQLLAHFFDETDGVLKQFSKKPAEGEKPPDKEKLREALDQRLGELEDMIALWNHRLPR